MKKILSLILLLTLLSACKKQETLEEIEARAGRTAVEYYKLLLEGQYDDVVAGTADGDSLPADYRSQLSDNAAMFVKQQTDEHRGIKEISLSRCHADTVTMTAEAFLGIVYMDSVKEVVCVPLVMQNNIWRMK